MLRSCTRLAHHVHGQLKAELLVKTHARDRLAGMSLTNVARKYGISRASVVRFVREAQRRATPDLNSGS